MATNPLKDKIAGLLAAGATPSQVARACGITESYISQLLTSDKEFEGLLAKHTAASLEEDIDLDKAYSNLEKSIINELAEKIPSGGIVELTKALAAVTANNRTGGLRKGKGVSNNGGVTSVGVTVNLPLHIVQNLDVVRNDRNEIVEIDGRDFRGLTEKEFSDSLPVLKQEAQSNDYAERDKNSEIGKRLKEISKVVGSA